MVLSGRCKSTLQGTVPYPFRQGPFEDDFSLSQGGDTGYVSWRVSLPSAIAADDDIKPSETKAEVETSTENRWEFVNSKGRHKMVKHRCYPLGSTFLLQVGKKDLKVYIHSSVQGLPCLPGN